MQKPKNLAAIVLHPYDSLSKTNKQVFAIKGISANRLNRISTLPKSRDVSPSNKDQLQRGGAKEFKRGDFGLGILKQTSLMMPAQQIEQQRFDTAMNVTVGDGCLSDVVIQQKVQKKALIENFRENNCQYFGQRCQGEKKKCRLKFNKLSSCSGSLRSQEFYFFKAKDNDKQIQKKPQRGREKVGKKPKSPTLIVSKQPPQSRQIYRSPQIFKSYPNQFEVSKHHRILSSENRIKNGSADCYKGRGQIQMKSQKQNQDDKVQKLIEVKRFGSLAKERFSQSRKEWERSGKKEGGSEGNLRVIQWKNKRDGSYFGSVQQFRKEVQEQQVNANKSVNRRIADQAKYHYYADSKLDSSTNQGLTYQKRGKQSQMEVPKYDGKKTSTKVQSDTQVKKKLPYADQFMSDNTFIQRLSSFCKTNTPQYKSKPTLFCSDKKIQNPIKTPIKLSYYEKNYKTGPSMIKIVKKHSGDSNISKKSVQSEKLLSFLSNRNVKKNNKEELFKLRSIGFENRIQEFVGLKRLAERDGCCITLVIHIETRLLYVLKSFVKKQENYQNFIRESKIQFSINHPHSVRLYSIMEDYRNLYMLMEYLQGGTLMHQQKEYICRKHMNLSSSETCQDSISSVSPHNSPQIIHCPSLIDQSDMDRQKHIVQIIHSLLEILQHLHCKGIMHRDIKPQNILISNSLYKLGDYGSATSNLSQEHIGTLDYAAPQILQQLSYDISVDMWSIGCVAYELVVGHPPFYHENRGQTYRRVIEGEFDIGKLREKGGDLMMGFVGGLLRVTGEDRLTVDQALRNPLFKAINNFHDADS